MDYDKIKFATLEVFQEHNLKSFPIDCEDILKRYGMKVQSYSSQKPKKRERCFYYSEDAFTLKKIVYYNDKKIPSRILFSLAHEIGHIALKHEEPRTQLHEDESDCFASYFLAPRMAIHYSRCKNHVQVSKQFGLSVEASQYAFDDYRRWHRRAVYKMNDFDKAIYSHFYNEQYKGFVYNVKTCKLCGKELLNHKPDYCDSCFNRLSFRNYNDRDFYAAENNWLYGGL